MGIAKLLLKGAAKVLKKSKAKVQVKKTKNVIDDFNKNIKNAKINNMTKDSVNRSGTKPFTEVVPLDLPSFSELVATSPPSQVLSLFEKSKTVSNLQSVRVSQVVSSTKTINDITNKGFSQIQGYRPQSKFTGNAKIGDVQSAINESTKYANAINIIYNGLEALKLGNITVEFKISGDIIHSGKVGTEASKGMKRSILQLTNSGQFTSIAINAFSYRGFRSDDPQQGGGISKVKAIGQASLR